MKGIILAGGAGTRLHPTTKAVNKHLLPIYNKPMIYYPLCTLMEAGIKDILIITAEEDVASYMKLLGHGWDFGINISYLIQPRPEGIAQALIIAHEFIDDESVCLILGDNVFHGESLSELTKVAIEDADKGIATIFGYEVSDPERYGVAELNEKNEVLSIEEKPKKPKSNYAVVGLYFYPGDVYSIASAVSPSARGELEITDVNNVYIEKSKLKLQKLGRGFAWLDTGTHEALLEAAMYVQTIEKRQGLSIADPYKIGKEMGWL